MKSLLLKDLYSFKGYGKIIVFVLLFFTVMAFVNDNISYMTGMVSGSVIFMFAMLAIATFTYDQQAKWDTYCQALPVSRTQMVRAKYVLGALFIGTGSLVTIVFSVVLSLLRVNSVNWSLILEGNVMVTFIALLVLAILFPLIYKFGVEKARVMIFAVLLIPAGVVLLLGELGVTIPDAPPTATIWLLLLVLTLGVMAISYKSSVRIYSQKDF